MYKMKIEAKIKIWFLCLYGYIFTVIRWSLDIFMVLWSRNPMIYGCLQDFFEASQISGLYKYPHEADLIRKSRSHRGTSFLTKIVPWIVKSFISYDSLLEKIKEIYKRIKKSDLIWFFMLKIIRDFEP